LLISAAGCGGATAPCPTPTTELDQLRDRSERLEQDLTRATSEDRKVSAQREEAARRVAAAQAALDSIARPKGR
jgi:cytochrome c-type biogenesis protein CcmH/NrfG